MNTTAIGRRAEETAARFLLAKGCEVIGRNWRTRRCEIDVIALRRNVIYFCEVKYRSQDRQGAGLDYVTPAKLQQMRFAAESWVHVYKWQGEYHLAAIEVSGPHFRVTAAVNDLG